MSAAWTDAPACDSGPHERQRQRLQDQPRAAGPHGRQHGFPKNQEQYERADQSNRQSLPAKVVITISGYQPASADGREIVQLESRALLDQLQQHGEARIVAALQRNALLNLECASGDQDLRRRSLGAGGRTVLG